MSRVRNYNLRTRADVGSVNQSQPQEASTLSRTPIHPTPPVLGTRSLVGSPAPLYSDVVASRGSSPMRDSPPVVITQTEVVPVTREPIIGNTRPEIRVVPTVSRENIKGVENDTSSEGNVSPEEPGDTPWTTVKRRRAHSLESYELASKNRSGSSSAKKLTLEQVQAVRAAAETLTMSQKDVIREREKKITQQRRTSSPSREGGTSRPKGKGIDPREWGNVNISQESLDINAQEAALRSFARKDGMSNYKDREKVEKAHQSGRREDRSPST